MSRSPHQASLFGSSNTLNVSNNQTSQPSRLDSLIKQLEPILKHINLHRFLWLFTVVCALIAWNRGLMLLYALVAFLLAILLVSYIYYALNLSILKIKARLPTQEVVSNEPFIIKVQLDSRLPQHFLSIDFMLQRVHQRDISKAILPAESLTSQVPFTAKASHAASDNADYQHISLFVLYSRGQQTFSCEGRLTRGVYHLPVANIQCAYPLGIVNKQRTTPLSEHTWTAVSESKPAQKTINQNTLFYVLPTSFTIRHLPLSGADSQGEAQMVSKRRGTQDEFADIRRYRRGDALKTVHWGASARQLSRGKALMVKNYDTLQTPHALILLNQFDFSGSSLIDSQFSMDTMITLAVSFARYLCAQNYQVSMVGFDEPFTALGAYWQIDFASNILPTNDSLRKLAEINHITQQQNSAIIRPHAVAPLPNYKAFTDLLSSKRPDSLMVQFSNHIPHLQHTSKAKKAGQGQQHRVYLSTQVKSNRFNMARDGSVQYEINPRTPLAGLQTLFDSNGLNINTDTQITTHTTNPTQFNQDATLARSHTDHASA